MSKRRKKVYIIGEAGVNHNGSLKLAKQLIDVAARCGCDAVKFQVFQADLLLSKKAHLAQYQKEGISSKIKTQHDLIKGLELSFEDFEKLYKHCEKRGIEFLATPFDKTSVDWLMALKVSCFKISSGELTNLPFLDYVSRKKKPMILSTGMANMDEIKEAVDTIKKNNSKIVLLHCITEYPAPMDQLNLRAIQTLQNHFGVEVGFSDHSLGIEASPAAVALGATIIEKHFTLDRGMAGPDHKASLEENQLKNMITNIRLVESALGDGVKKIAACEKKYVDLVRKSLVAVSTIDKGQVIKESDLAIKRPAGGIGPKAFNRVIGLKARKRIVSDSIIRWSDVYEKA